MKLRVNPRVGSLVVMGVLAVSFTWVNAQQRAVATVAIDSDDVGGIVTSVKGPEAGVWVIAETTDLPTKFARMVVTDDQGRYILPDLPRANYRVFVRGYGLVDSAWVSAKPGQRLDLTAVVAPNGRAAAQVYPANYWLGLLEIPKGELSPADVLSETKACFSCHQVGDQATREISKNLGLFTSSLDAWDHHMTVGPAGPGMSANFKRLEDADVTRSLPVGVLLSLGVGTDRRPEWRMEGSRGLVELLNLHALAPRGRQGHVAKDCEVPGPTESCSEIGRVSGTTSVFTWV